ncbi:RNA polymerase sigma-70 factor [Prolixibacteraceae bacterium Z1-6]|uniref:RNA polymerase sigma factor n=1 Tax=Draconibacterium aestuarii TaxID=2998507 RepID=A0A9X3F672_9BACT|nr:RNA polymerase sigma-70 factor [Prolixibacteraceae bacterium Z1-6]
MFKEFNLGEIVKQLAKNDDSSLEELFNYYYPRLYNFSKSFLKIEEGIDDILQEVFVKIWQNRKKINNSATFNSYIFTITRNLLLNELRSRLNNQNIKEEVRKLSVAQEYLSFNLYEYQELKEKVDKLINEIPDRQKEIFVLSRNEGLTHKEIAEKLGITTKTVEYHMSAALRFIREELKVYGVVSLLYFYLFF